MRGSECDAVIGVSGDLATPELIEQVYDELRRLASQHLRRERRDHTLQPTALVHEAYLRMTRLKGYPWQNRAQFFGLASQIMRNILVSYALVD